MVAALPSCASKGAANTLNVSEGGTKFFHSSAFRNKKRLSNEERLKFNLDDKLKQILIGNIFRFKEMLGILLWFYSLYLGIDLFFGNT